MSQISLLLRKQIIDLRKKGASYKKIAKELSLSPSTVWLYAHDTSITQDGIEKIKKNRQFDYHKLSMYWKNKRQEKEILSNNHALEVIKCLKRNGCFYKICCALLFWCEGTKNYRDGVRFTNSDPLLMQTFLALFRKSFNLDEKRFRALMHLHSYHNELKQLNFWSQITKIPKSQFLKTFWKNSKHQKTRVDYEGCLSLRYNDSNIAKQLHSFYKTFAKKLNN